MQDFKLGVRTLNNRADFGVFRVKNHDFTWSISFSVLLENGSIFIWFPPYQKTHSSVVGKLPHTVMFSCLQVDNIPTHILNRVLFSRRYCRTGYIFVGECLLWTHLFALFCFWFGNENRIPPPLSCVPYVASFSWLFICYSPLCMYSLMFIQ